MKKCFCVLVIVLLLLFVGCAAAKTAVDNYAACKGDDACMSQMVANGDIAVKLVKSTSAQNWLEIIAFNIVSGLSGVLLGSKLKRKV